MSKTIMEAVNEMLSNPSGVGGSIVDKLNQVIEEKGGEAHPTSTIEECVTQIAALDAEAAEEEEVVEDNDSPLSGN